MDDHRRHLNTELHTGDVVIVRSGLAGSAVSIPAELDGCNCVDLVVVRRCSQVVPKYLEYVINSTRTQGQVRLGTSGALLMHFNADDCAELVIPLRPVEAQARIVRLLDDACGRVDLLKQSIERQVRLLVERRQALVTSAVTGEMQMAGVAA